MPKSVAPVVFPPIVVPPDQLVSSELLDAIRDADGLIYLEGGASAKSFWVALERDYALRIGKPVFRFDAANNVLQPDTSPPLELNVFIASSHHDRDAVNQVLSLLRERFFILQFDNWVVPREGEGNPDTYEVERRQAADRISNEIMHTIARRGYVLSFWSTAAAASNWMNTHHGFAFLHHRSRILFALLEDVPVRLALDSMLAWWPEDIHALIRERLVDKDDGVNTPEDFFAQLQNESVQVYGDAERSQLQRIDDLIVRLYWLIYQNTFTRPRHTELT
jgi:hypothetical protein